MPRIPDDYLDCVVYLYPTIHDVDTNSNVGGTGFLLHVTEVMDKGEAHFVYVVTCAHNIENGAAVIGLNSATNKRFAERIPPSDWTLHPDKHDVAVCLLPITSQPPRFRCVRSYQSVGLLEANSGIVGLGDEVFMVGRFATHQGKERNIPVVRFGNISMMPHETILQDRGHEQKSYLVEARSLSGLSGSPVFTYEPYVRMDEHSEGSCGHTMHRDLGMRGGNARCIAMGHPLLLGMDWGNVRVNEEGILTNGDKTQSLKSYNLRANSGFAAIVPAWQIIELIYLEEISVKRRELGAELLGRRVNAIPE